MSLPYRRPLILLVDEDEKLARLLRSVLACEGFGVVNVPSGQAALDRLRAMHEPPRLIILEPDTPGTTACELLKVLASDATFTGIPVVLLCREPKSFNTPSVNVVAQLGKPVPVEEMLALVKKHAQRPRGRMVPADRRRSAAASTR
jgi:DNA-binding response OmpR family regulator